MVVGRSEVVAYVGLGANLGDPIAMLRKAVQALEALPASHLRARSSIYQTAPLDTPVSTGADQSAQPDYFNAVVALSTRLVAPELLAYLQKIEQSAGRERPYPNAPRTLDLDLLLYGGAHVQSPHLWVPHPRMMQRAFVLLPLAEIAPELVSLEQLQQVAEQRVVRLDALLV